MIHHSWQEINIFIEHSFYFPLFCVILIITLYYGKMSIYGNLSGWPDTYFTEESNRSVIRQFNPIASCSNVLIFGFASSFIPSWTVDFGTPDMMESCRTDKFLSYIIWDNRIFIFLLFQHITKIWKEVYQTMGLLHLFRSKKNFKPKNRYLNP